MKVLEFILANILVIGGAISFTRCLRITGFVEGVLCGFTWYIAQIVGSLLLAGGLFAILNDVGVLGINIVISLVLFGLSLKVGAPLARGAALRYYHRLTHFAQEIFANPWAYILLALVTAEIFWVGYVALIEPPYEYDALSYHLVAMVSWLQAGRFVINPYGIFVNAYPFNTELIFTWLAIFLHSSALIKIGQLILAIGGMLALISLCRTLGLKVSTAIAAGTLYFFVPIVMVQAGTNYVDVGFASMFLVFFAFIFQYMRYQQAHTLLLVGISGGICLGMKSSAFAYISIALLALIGQSAYYHRTMGATKRYIVTMARFFSMFLIFSILPLLTLGLYWYLRDWVVYGNPLYPVTITLFGHIVFPGLGTVQDLILGDNVPPVVRNQPLWRQLATSWTNEPPVYPGYLIVPGQYTFDQRLGGLGVQWIALEFPALTVFSIYAFFKERLALWGFIIPFMLIFLVQPGNWWSRYTIFIVAPGIVAACYAAERLRWRVGREFIKGGAIILSLVSVFFATTHGVFAPAFVTKVAKIPRAQRTIGNIFYPEYRWVDFIPNGARIGTPGSTDSHFGRYPLFGSRLENIVIMIATPDKATFEQNLHANQIQYYFTSAGTPDAAWAAADPHDFTLIDTTDQVNRVYLIHW